MDTFTPIQSLPFTKHLTDTQGLALACIQERFFLLGAEQDTDLLLVRLRQRHLEELLRHLLERRASRPQVGLVRQLDELAALGRLQVVHEVVQDSAPVAEELEGRGVVNQAALVHAHDLVAVDDGLQAVGDGDDGALGEGVADGRLDQRVRPESQKCSKEGGQKRW